VWAQADALALHHTLCSRAAIEAAHRRGAPVLVWTVDDPAEQERFAALGVDAVVTDRWLH
jgi:glycerophosphoryl diester phosphodiesterase